MTYDSTLKDIGSAAGHMPLKNKLTFRCSELFQERLEQAAADCDGMSPTEWIRWVLGSALDAHETRQRRIMAGLDPDGPDIDDEEIDEDMVQSPDPSDPDYAELVAAAAPELRTSTLPAEIGRQEPDGAVVLDEPETDHVTTRAPKPEPINPRDCPHLPQWRRGSKCRCGTTVTSTGSLGRLRIGPTIR